MGFPLYVTCCFSLAVFNILYLFLTILVTMCLGVILFGLILFGTLCFLDLDVYFLSHVREVFSYYGFKYFSAPFSLSFPSVIPRMRMLVHFILSQRSLKLSSFLFILYYFFCLASVISPALSSSLLICS